jgi:hypothetical protein
MGHRSSSRLRLLVASDPPRLLAVEFADLSWSRVKDRLAVKRLDLSDYAGSDTFVAWPAALRSVAAPG